MCDDNQMMLQDILNFHIHIDTGLLSKANFIFGAATAVAFFLLGKIISPDFLSYPVMIRFGIGIICAGSGISAFFSLLVILPKIRILSRKDRSRQDIFYYKNIREYYSLELLCAYLKDLPHDEDKIVRAYGHQIHSLATRVIPFKFRMLKISGWTLICCVAIWMLLVGGWFIL